MYTSGFYQAAWPIVGAEVTQVVRNFFTTGRLLRQVNATVLTLIPKVHNPTRISDFRPIACCNVLYKVITKIIVERMSLVMDKLISPAQTTFALGLLAIIYYWCRSFL